MGDWLLVRNQIRRQDVSKKHSFTVTDSLVHGIKLEDFVFYTYITPHLYQEHIEWEDMQNRIEAGTTMTVEDLNLLKPLWSILYPFRFWKPYDSYPFEHVVITRHSCLWSIRQVGWVVECINATRKDGAISLLLERVKLSSANRRLLVLIEGMNATEK